MFGVLEAISVPNAGIYNTYEDLERALNERVGKEGYTIVKARSHRRPISVGQPEKVLVRCDLVCDRGGRPYRSAATKHKTTTKKTGCPWKAKAVNRKTIGGWVLTIACDQHNHEPGTPEPPTPSELGEAEDHENVEAGDDAGEDAEDDDDNDGPRPDPETSAAMQVAGVSNAVLRLTGETFHQFKCDYRSMSQPERLGILSQLQLRIAAIYAVQNEDVQRNQRQEAQQRRFHEIDEGRRQRQQQKRGHRQRQQQQQQHAQNAAPEMIPQQQQQQQHQRLGTPTQAHLHASQQHIPPQNQAQHPQHLSNQQFHIAPDHESQRLMAMSAGINLALPQQPPYSGSSKRPRGHRPSSSDQQS